MRMTSEYDLARNQRGQMVSYAVIGSGWLVFYLALVLYGLASSNHGSQTVKLDRATHHLSIVGVLDTSLREREQVSLEGHQGKAGEAKFLNARAMANQRSFSILGDEPFEGIER
jgi:hypothetical protein